MENIERASKLDRYFNNISAHPVLAVDPKSQKIIIGAPDINDGKITLELKDVTGIEVGMFVDCILSYVRSSGRVTSYSVRFLGLTPKKFWPSGADREDAG